MRLSGSFFIRSIFETIAVFLLGLFIAPPAIFAALAAPTIRGVEFSKGNVYVQTEDGVVAVLRITDGISVDGFQMVVRESKTTDTKKIELIVGYPGEEVASEFVWINGEFTGASNVQAVVETLTAFRETEAGAVLGALGATEFKLTHDCVACVLEGLALEAAVFVACTPPAVLAPGGPLLCAAAVAALAAWVIRCRGACRKHPGEGHYSDDGCGCPAPFHPECPPPAL